MLFSYDLRHADVFGIHGVQLGVQAALLHQLLMGALLLDAVLGEHPDDRGVADGGQAVGDGEGGAAVRELFKRLLHQAFAFVVQGAGRLVQDQDRWVFEEHAGDGNALLLAAGQLYAALAHIGSRWAAGR